MAGLNGAMPQLNATQLSAALNVSKGRVSQYVAEGKLDGCYSGDGRARRFDLHKCAAALGRKLDKGQLLGNGAQTRAALASIGSNEDTEQGKPEITRKGRKTDGPLPKDDPDEYTLTKTALQKEELRKRRLDNAEREGRYVLSSEVERQVTRMLSQEIAEVESTVIREGARAIADQLGVDFKTARKILTDVWRAHRKGRSEVLAKASEAAQPTAAEKAAAI